jgi:hypothetical protein
MTVNGDFDAKLSLCHVSGMNVLPSVETEVLLENDVVWARIFTPSPCSIGSEVHPGHGFPLPSHHRILIGFQYKGRLYHSREADPLSNKPRYPAFTVGCKTRYHHCICTPVGMNLYLDKA